MRFLDVPYLQLLEDVYEEGETRKDRTGVGTYSLFGKQAIYDISSGFPLLTTKKVSFKNIAVELLWFLKGDTNTAYLEEHGVAIWDKWRKPYGFDRSVILVEPKVAKYESYDGDFSYNGLNTVKCSVERKLVSLWLGMMRRCYSPDNENYQFYGARGVSVHKRWHVAANFIADVQTLPHWFYKQKDWGLYELDKDYYGSNQYGPETCVWLHRKENAFYMTTAKPIRVVSATGECQLYTCLNEASRDLGIPTSTLSRFIGDGAPRILKGANRAYIGWEFDEYKVDGKLVRLALIPNGDLGPVYGRQWRNFGGVDQIAEIEKQLKKDPASRRIILSAWNPAEIQYMALPPCHMMAQFYVSHGHVLDCQLYQRSADMFLGVPYNIASYSLLTYMLAKTHGFVPGRLIHTIGDCHIYSNHTEQINEQLRRSPKQSPQLTIQRQCESILDYRLEDFAIVGYDPWPAISAPVAV